VTSPWRALAVGACGVALLCLVTPYNDEHLRNTALYSNFLPVGGLFLFALLAIAFNPLLRRFVPRAVFQPAELLLIWAMLTTGAGLAASGLWRYLTPMVVAPAYFAASGRGWLDALQGTPDWLLLSRNPQSPLVLWFYHGLPYGQTTPWAAWTKILIGWGSVLAAIAALSIGLSALFHKQWVVRERLTYPLVQLPLQIATDMQARHPLTRNRLFWAGCLTVILLHTLSTAHHFAPSFPGFPDNTDIAGWQQTPPWKALELPSLQILFAVIGGIYLLPTDVSLTLWAIYLAFHLARVLRVMRGYDPLMSGPLNHEAAIAAGAVIAWSLWMAWSARPHWRAVWQAALRPGEAQERDEPLPARIALALVALGMVGMAAWLRAASVPWMIGVPIVVLFSMLLLALARIMAESGLLYLDTSFIPSDVTAIAGTQMYTSASATVVLMSEVVLIHDPSVAMIPAITNAYALAEGGSIRPRVFTGGIVLAILLGFFASFVGSVWLHYRYGAVTLDTYAASGAPHIYLDRALDYVHSPLSFDRSSLQALLLGGLLALLCVSLKVRFLWWPFGPIGLVMGPTWAMNQIYFSVFLGWACKALTLRIGGLKLYRTALPYFLGLLLGEGLFGGLSALWGLATGVSAPVFLPQ
jgi:hypothetical protein